MSLPGTPDAPIITSSVQRGTFTATINVDWTSLMDTGGVPLTGYNMTRVSTNAQTLAYDGTNQPQTTSASITLLVLNEDYTFTVSGLNPYELLRVRQLQQEQQVYPLRQEPSQKSLTTALALASVSNGQPLQAKEEVL